MARPSVSLASSREIFESDDRADQVARLPVASGQVTTAFEGLAAGEYAIKVFHDVNENERLDIGWRGPEEPYGFSNDATGFMGPPDFDDAKFEFDGSRLAIEIHTR